MIFAALALAATPLASATPQTAIAAIYAPFRQATPDTSATWDRPIFTPRLTVLIAKWRAVTPNDEVDDLSDFDWLCQCQDWDSLRFRARITRSRSLGPSRRAVKVVLGGQQDRPEPVRFVLQRSGNRWLIDDIFAGGFSGGLRATLVRTTAADIALRKQR